MEIDNFKGNKTFYKLIRYKLCCSLLLENRNLGVPTTDYIHRSDILAVDLVKTEQFLWFRFRCVYNIAVENLVLETSKDAERKQEA